jgi:hypothetical protein
MRITEALFVLLAFCLMGCQGNEALTPLATALDQVIGYGAVDAHFCTSPPSPGQQKIKYLFIMDHSAGNQPGFPPPVCGAGEVLVTNVDPNACWTLCGDMVTEATNPANGQCVTFTAPITNADANGFRRYGPMINFINNLAPDPNNLTSFALIDFNDSAKLAQGMDGFDSSGAPHFLNTYATPDWIGSGSATIPVPVDGGFSDYNQALSLAYNVIYDDATLEAATASSPPVLSQYVIVFVTSGVPTIATPAGATPTCTESLTGNGCGGGSIQSEITNLMNLKTSPNLGPYISSVSLNTAYYFNTQSDPFAVSLLQQMAAGGNGLYVQFGSGASVLYQQFAPPSRNIGNQLVDVFTQNVNGVWWDNGQFMADSDGDGLPDLIELQYGSNPNVADSDGNGVSDYVEFRTKGKPCNDAKCSPANRDSYGICSGYKPITAVDGTVTYASSANDGLNDCEKFVLGGTVATFNSNGDMIPDAFAAFNSLSILPSSAGIAQADPFGDGFTNYAKLKLGLPIQVSSQTLLDIKSRTTTLTIESQPTAQTTCYHYVVSNVAFSATQNLIKLMVIQNNATLQDHPFLMNATKVPGDNGVASFAPSDFH